MSSCGNMCHHKREKSVDEYISCVCLASLQKSLFMTECSVLFLGTATKDVVK